MTAKMFVAIMRSLAKIALILSRDSRGVEVGKCDVCLRFAMLLKLFAKEKGDC